MAGERLEECRITEVGLEGDRRWALIDGTPNRAGKWFNIKQHAALMTYRSRLVDGRVAVSAPDASALSVDEAFQRILDESGRPVTLRELPGENFDAAHVLVVNLASVAAFAAEAGMPVDHRRFRANVYVDGIDPFEEIGWVGRILRAGEAELEATSLCERCKVITMDPDTTEATPDLLRVLVDRHDELFGVYCRVVRPGRIALGDSVRTI